MTEAQRIGVMQTIVAGIDEVLGEAAAIEFKDQFAEIMAEAAISFHCKSQEAPSVAREPYRRAYRRKSLFCSEMFDLLDV